jgi:hypothetical protein
MLRANDQAQTLQRDKQLPTRRVQRRFDKEGVGKWWRARSGRRISWICAWHGMAVHRPKIASSETIFFRHLRGVRHTNPSFAINTRTLRPRSQHVGGTYVLREQLFERMGSLYEYRYCDVFVVSFVLRSPMLRVCNDHYGLCSPSHLSCCREAPSLRTPQYCYSLA